LTEYCSRLCDKGPQLCKTSHIEALFLLRSKFHIKKCPPVTKSANRGYPSGIMFWRTGMVMPRGGLSTSGSGTALYGTVHPLVCSCGRDAARTGEGGMSRAERPSLSPKITDGRQLTLTLSLRQNQQFRAVLAATTSFCPTAPKAPTSPPRTLPPAPTSRVFLEMQKHIPAVLVSPFPQTGTRSFVPPPLREGPSRPSGWSHPKTFHTG